MRWGEKPQPTTPTPSFRHFGHELVGFARLPVPNNHCTTHFPIPIQIPTKVSGSSAREHRIPIQYQAILSSGVKINKSKRNSFATQHSPLNRNILKLFILRYNLEGLSSYPTVWDFEMKTETLGSWLKKHKWVPLTNSKTAG